MRKSSTNLKIVFVCLLTFKLSSNTFCLYPFPFSLLPPASNLKPFSVVAFLFNVVLCKIDAPLTEDLRDSPLTALNAIRDAHSSVAPARKGEAGNLGATILDECDTVEVLERVLRHAEVPSENSRE